MSKRTVGYLFCADNCLEYLYTIQILSVTRSTQFVTLRCLIKLSNLLYLRLLRYCLKVPDKNLLSNQENW